MYAKWAYLVLTDFELNGGSWNNDESYYVPNIAFSGDVITLPIATKTGYHDGHWRCNGVRYEFGGSFKIPETAINTPTFTFVAHWTPNTYTITFDFNGGRSSGGSSNTSKTVYFGKTVPTIVPPVRDGYRFVAYKTTKDEKGVAYYKLPILGSMIKEIYDITGDVTLYAHWEIAYPQLNVVSKTGSTWKIEITNTGSTLMTFEYNKKMLFEKDAKVWNVSDNDKGSVAISSYLSKTVDITENWFATCIAVSVKIDDTRYITYAYNLDAKTKTLTPVNCYVSA